MFRTFTAAAILILTAAAAQAGTPANMDVRFGDLDLNSPRDGQVLAVRIHAAAEAVCGPVAYTNDGRASAVYDAMATQAHCVHAAVERAQAQIQALRARRTLLSRN